ncbi:MAG: hypothetical protein H7306_08270 [Bacteriovorax sp.]|nr:hypothetical protein [Rhizobacter sp.]
MLELEQHLRRTEIDVLAGVVVEIQRLGPSGFDVFFSLGTTEPVFELSEALCQLRGGFFSLCRQRRRLVCRK